MRRTWLLGAVLGLLLPSVPARAVDHGNLDAGRPLQFEDAEPVALGERTLEAGLAARWPRRRPLGGGLDLELLYGAALNSHVSLGLESAFGGRAGERRTRFDLERIEVGALHNFNRQVGNLPALSLRADVSFPAGGTRGEPALRLRGIASRNLGQYGRIHVNADLEAEPGAARGTREFRPGVILGYSHPLGLTRRFDRTLLAQLGARASDRSGRGAVVTAGIGLRQQTGARTVFDVGLLAGIASTSRARHDRLSLAAGLSHSF